MIRYSLYNFSKEIKKIDKNFQVNDEDLLLPNYNISPGTKVPIIKLNLEDNSFEINRTSSWGYKRSKNFYINMKTNNSLYSKTIKKKITRSNKDTLKHVNFRIKSIKKSKNLTQLYNKKKSRCIVPASSYFKWISIFKKFERKIDDHEGIFEKLPLKFYNSKKNLFFFIGFSYTSETKEWCHSLITHDSIGKFKKVSTTLPIVLDFNMARLWLENNDPINKIINLNNEFIKYFEFHKVTKSVNRINYNNKEAINRI